MLTDDERCCEFFYDWAMPSQIADPIFVNLLDSADGPCTLAVCRPWSSEPFATPEVLRLVRLLAPHARRAMQAQLERFQDWRNRWGDSSRGYFVIPFCR